MRNNRGIAMILTYLLTATLITISAAFYTQAVAELRQAQRNRESSAAFWLAEAGMAEALYELRQSAQWSPPGLPTQLGEGEYDIQLTNLTSSLLITVSGTANVMNRVVQAELDSINMPYHNTMSSGGDMELWGLLARLEVYDRTRLTGNFSKSGWGASASFEDKVEGVPIDETTLSYPDANENGTADEFDDFIQHNRVIINSYDPDEVVYIQTEGTVNIFPTSYLAGKKIVYVEGTSPGSGDVNIFFDATWRDAEDLTVISTGTVDYVQPLQFQQNARLNTISWDDYHEFAIFLSKHESVNYAHDEARYFDLFDLSWTTGNIIANEGIYLTEIISLKKFYYSDRIEGGNIPPGFEGLVSAGGTLSSTPRDWREVRE